MIQITHIVPTDYLSYLPLHKRHKCIHLLLAHQVLNDYRYTSYFLEKKLRGDYLILDNSAFEFGEAIADTRLVEAIKLCNPNEVILPDRLYDSATTINRSLEFLEKYKHLNIRFMAVAQGNTLNEWVSCYEKFAYCADIYSIGLGAVYCSSNFFPKLTYLNTRVGITHHLNEFNVVNRKKPHHLLGLGDSGHLELKNQIQFEWIRSCDSSAAFTQALSGSYINRKQAYSKAKSKLDFLLPYSADLFARLKHNITVLNKGGE